MSEQDGPLYRKWWKVYPFPSCCLPCNSLLHPCRAAVSQKKTRFRQDGFDLDLTYVTKRIIVHGFPATGVEHIYRNPRNEVRRLLDRYHLDHYKVYNFANEPGRAYPAHFFEGRVERFPFADHTCPPLESVVDFCESAKAWLDIDESNVVSLHCKAGKGRAGIMAACLMVRLGETAEAAVNKFDETRVSDKKGLTVVNQRKWVFLYERLVKEVWRLQESIAMVPGRDPDLRAPPPRAVSLREISVQLQPDTEGKRNDSILPNVSCAVYQQRSMGKHLVMKAKMVPMCSREGELSTVIAAALPRSVTVEGTFQIVLSAAVGAATTQREAIDLWCNTTFLDSAGGWQSFSLDETDVSPPKLAIRLRQARCKIGVCHTRPYGESPPRRASVTVQAGSNGRSSEATTEAGRTADQALTASHTTQEEDQALSHNRNSALPAVPGSVRQNSSGASKIADRSRETSTSQLATAKEGDNEAEQSAKTVAGDEGDDTAPPRRDASERAGTDASIGVSPAFPGPSPAGWPSPVWMYEGRVSSPGTAPSQRRPRRMWWSGSVGGSQAESQAGQREGEQVSPRDMVDQQEVSLPLEDREGEETRAKRRSALRRSPASRSDSMGSEAFYVAENGTLPADQSMRSKSVSTAWPSTGTGASVSRDNRVIAAATRAARIGRDRSYRFGPHNESETESDDQVAVRASAFGGKTAGTYRGPGLMSEQQALGQGTAVEPAVSGNTRWAMEMAFAQERRRWEEHQQCLETELDWALAARARAEARSEEESARVGILEERLSAWRSEYSVIETDVKQAVRLLEMSLSGLMSAENALKKWKGQIPSKAYDDIMGCLTRGDTPVGRS